MEGVIVICIATLVTVANSCPSNDGIVKLSYNNLQTITKDMFGIYQPCINGITTLNLSNNDITSIEEDSFLSLYDVQTLDLSHNNIEELNLTTFRGSRFLVNLDLSYNKFKILQAGLLHDNLFHLSTVSFEANNIYEVEWGFVNANHEHLLHVNLRNNNLTVFDPWPYLIKWTGNTTKEDRIFDMQYNNISSITNHYNWTFDLKFPYEVEVNLMFNKIDTLSVETVRQFKSDITESGAMSFFLTFYMNVTNNPFFCDCKVYQFAKSLRDSFLRWRDVEEYRYRCAAPAELADGDWLHDIPLQYLVCNITTACPEKCFCQERPHNNTFLIDCRGVGLEKLPDIVPELGNYNLEFLLDDNMITELHNVSYIGQIYNMSLNNNRIHHLSEETVYSMTSIKQLDLRYNQLQYLPNVLQRIDYGSVQLNGNPLRCGCDSLWMTEWFQLHEEDGDLLVKCTDDFGNDHKVIDLNLSDMGCTNDYIIIVSAIGAVLAGIIIAALVFAKRCPYETKVIVFKVFHCHPGDKYNIDQNPNITRDIYTSFDIEDVDVRKWVMNVLVEKLNHKKPHYSLMIPFIHFLAGPKHDQIDEWICKSKRIVIVLSENYFENEDCEMEAMCAATEQYEKPDTAANIIYIVFNEKTMNLIRYKIEEEPWKTRLAGKRILSPGDRLFWSKLRYELPLKDSNEQSQENIIPRNRQARLKNRLPLNDLDQHNGIPRNKQGVINDQRNRRRPVQNGIKILNHQDQQQIQNEAANRTYVKNFNTLTPLDRPNRGNIETVLDLI